MKGFVDLELDLLALGEEINGFEALLESKEELSEQQDVLSFFRNKINLSGFLMSIIPVAGLPDRIAYEYSIFGDFKCDLVLGCKKANTYCFVEFEDATASSIFMEAGNRFLPNWGTRFEKGYSQIVDWFWKLDDMKQTDAMVDAFSGSKISYYGILVIGRDKYVSTQGMKRLDWRLQNTLVNSKHIYCLTFDELCDILATNYKQIKKLSDDLKKTMG